jgi:hypothetical protein
MNRIEIARQLDYIREAGSNAGQRVEGIQRWGGGQKGDSWCCYFATMVLDIEFKGNAPIPRTGRCQDVYELAKQRGWIVQVPEPGDLYLFVNGDEHAHHIGIVTAAIVAGGGYTVAGISGNTSGDGQSSNGNGVYEHELLVPWEYMRFVRVPAE